jgi:hypothetical protein
LFKAVHEIRDAIHVFIRYDTDERLVIDSPQVQRLRNIHQLAMTYLVYPGATHRRFEHSLGVMELAGRVFDSVIRKARSEAAIQEAFPDLQDPDKLSYWRRVLRLAALCHDIGHLPFSHAAEKELLPEGWTHERLTAELLLNSPLRELLEKQLRPRIDAEEVARVALGVDASEAIGMDLTPWETFLSEIIVGNAFGVDRIDYLLRDSLHAGVAYGHFDHHRLIDTLRILIPPQPEQPQQQSLFTGKEDLASVDPVMGVEQGGLQGVEALLIARYMMYTQVYFHPVRRIYDLHLKQFLTKWLAGGRFKTDAAQHMALSDNEVSAAINAASLDTSQPGHVEAKRIVSRDHFRVLAQRNPGDQRRNPKAISLLAQGAAEYFGPDAVLLDEHIPKASIPEFPVLLDDGQVVSSASLMVALPAVQPFGFLFINKAKESAGLSWLQTNKERILGSN